MPTWLTILVAVLGGSFFGGVATVLAARCNATSESRTRKRDLTAEAYANALAGIEEVFQAVHQAYSGSHTGPTEDDETADTRSDRVRTWLDDVYRSASAKQAAAKLLSSAEVERALMEFNRVLAKELAPGLACGEGETVMQKLDTLHDALLRSMKQHLRELVDEQPWWKLWRQR